MPLFTGTLLVQIGGTLYVSTDSLYSNISQIDYTNYSNLLGQISIKGKTPFQIIDFLKLDIFEIPTGLSQFKKNDVK